MRSRDLGSWLWIVVTAACSPESALAPEASSSGLASSNGSTASSAESATSSTSAAGGGGVGGAGGASSPSGGQGGSDDVWWSWSQSWPGLFFEGTEAIPAVRFDLPIPSGATIGRVEMSYSVDIGQVVAGNRHQFSFTCADAGHPYSGGLFGFLFLADQLGNYVFRNGRPGEGATAPTKLPFKGLASTEVEVALRWDAAAGTAVVEVTDHLGGVAGVTSHEKVEPTFVQEAISVFFGYDTITMSNPAESASIGWKYRDLELRAAP